MTPTECPKSLISHDPGAVCEVSVRGALPVDRPVPVAGWYRKRPFRQEYRAEIPVVRVSLLVESKASVGQQRRYQHVVDQHPAVRGPNGLRPLSRSNVGDD